MERQVGAALHVCQILEAFTAEEPNLTLTQLATRVGLRPSSVLRLVRTLASAGLVTFDRPARRYRLGSMVTRLASVYRASHTLVSLALPLLVALRDETRETAALHVRQGQERLCLLEAESCHPIRMRLELERSYPLDAGAAGHVLRAFSADWEQQPDRPRIDLVRSRGWTVSRAEVIPDSIAVCVPVIGPSGALLAALGVHGPAYRIADEQLPHFVACLSAAAQELAAISPPEPIWR